MVRFALKLTALFFLALLTALPLSRPPSPVWASSSPPAQEEVRLHLGSLRELTWDKHFTMRLEFEGKALSLSWRPETTLFLSSQEEPLAARAFFAAFQNRTIAVEADLQDLALRVYPIDY